MTLAPPVKRNKDQKIVAICQPNFMPWSGFFEMAERADVLVMLDDAQYVRRDWINRNRIRAPGSENSIWMTVPVMKSDYTTPINRISINQTAQWQTKMLKTISRSYAKAPAFEQIYMVLSNFFLEENFFLSEFNIRLIKIICDQLNMECEITRASETNIHGQKDDRLAAICQHYNADVYLANSGSRAYIRPEKFYDRGIGFIFQDYLHPIYYQGRAPFLSHLSIIDLLFWHGDNAKSILLKGRPTNWSNQISY